MLSQLLNFPVTITRRSSSGTQDDYGSDLDTETVVETVGELQQQRRTEDPLAEVSDTTWLLILPAGTDIRTGDSVEADGQTFEMVGDPWPVRHPWTRAESHVEATLRRVAGAEDAS